MRPDVPWYQKAFPVFPTGRMAPRSFPETPKARARPEVAKTHSSENVVTRSLRGDAWPVDSAPTMGLAGSATQFTERPVVRSIQSFPTMPWAAGCAPVPMVAWPGAVTVCAWSKNAFWYHTPPSRSRRKPSVPKRRS
jgi:hypothetical protein